MRRIQLLPFLAMALMGAAPQQGLAPNMAVPPHANTADPTAPFYIDISGLNLGTTPPTRDPKNPHYPPATELPDGALPPRGAVGNFILGPTHTPAPETKVQARVAKGRIVRFTISSADSTIYHPGIVRAEASFNASVWNAHTQPGDPSNLIVTTAQAGSWTRSIDVYIPAGLSPKRAAPFMVVGDGEYHGGGLLIPGLDNLIAQHRIPPIIVVFVGSGGQDAQGSQRGREFDAVSGNFAAWLEGEVLPAVEQKAGVRLTRNPDGRAAMGGSSAGVAAFTCAWFRPDLYRRVLAYSPTFVNQQWPHDPALPGGAWQYHSSWPGGQRPGLAAAGFTGLVATSDAGDGPLILATPRKPIRMWFAVGDHDLFYPVASMADGMHDWVLANENMARVLAMKRYDYQFVFVRNGGHVDMATMAQTLPAALEWLWADYPAR